MVVVPGIYGYDSRKILPNDATKDYFTRINGSDGKYNYETHVNENATYYAYTIDNTGNISDRETMVINNIDNSWFDNDLLIIIVISLGLMMKL